MGNVTLDEATHTYIRFAAGMFGVTEAEVIARAVRLATTRTAEDAEPLDTWAAIPLCAEFDGKQWEASFIPATGRVRVTTEPLAGKAFKSPSGAARAIVAACKPERASPQTNGWTFWHIERVDGAPLNSVRHHV
jgi:hypothetical protein